MKKNVLIFFASYADAQLIPDLKSTIRQYLGERIILDSCDGQPRMDIKPLETDDYCKLNQIVTDFNSQSLQIIVVEADADLTLTNSIIYLKTFD